MSFSRLCRRAAPSMCLALAALVASAQTLSDPALEALYAGERTAELQRTAQQRLASQADDAQAVLALVLAALERNDAALRRDALDKARGCAGRQAKAQPCHYAHGVLLGVQAWSEALLREHADESAGPYGLARVKGELGDWTAAQALLEQAGKLKGAKRWPIGYRIGIAQQQLGRLDAARLSLQRFVAAGKGQKASLDDAKKRLGELGR